MRAIDELTKLKAACLYAEGRSEDQIAKILGKASSTVNGAIRWAIGQKRLRPQRPYVFIMKGLPQTQRKSLRQILADADTQLSLQRAIAEAVRAHDGSITPTVHVVPSGSRRIDARGWELRLERFGEAAEPLIRQFLSNVDEAAGVAWGATVASVVKGIEMAQTGPLPRTRPIWFVPVCGEPLGAPLSQESSSNLSSRLDAVLNKSAGHALSLAALPALTPVKEFQTAGDLEVLRRLFRRVKHYSEIFIARDSRTKGVPSGALAKKSWLRSLDAILCSIGPEDRTWGYRGDDLLESGDLERKELQSFVMGDIAGVLIPRQGMWSNPKLAMIRDHWNGIRLEDLQLCASRSASQKNVPGVCVVALGSNKAAFIRECLRLRDDKEHVISLINYLVVDDDCAARLLKLLGAPDASSRARPRGRRGGRANLKVT
jgi:DNA-binding transcriptional regulator LsrR (DeoR family)